MSGTKRIVSCEDIDMQTLLKQREELTKRICLLANSNLNEAVKAKLATFTFDQKVLDTIRHLLEEKLANEEILQLDDQDAIETIWNEMDYHDRPLLFVKHECVEGRMRECTEDECWYDLNHDRIQEWTHSYYNAAAPKKYVFCNVCIDNLQDREIWEEIIAAEKEELFPILYEQIKNQF